MQDSTYSGSQSLGIFGWNWSFLGEIQLETDTEGNVSLSHSGIEKLLPQQRSGTALYETDATGTPIEQLISDPYNLDIQQLFSQESRLSYQFHLQADGSYQSQSQDKGTLTKEGNYYQLRGVDGTLTVFRADGQLNYVENSNSYRITAQYTGDLLTQLSAQCDNNR